MQRTTSPKESQPGEGTVEPQIRLPDPMQRKALMERLEQGQLLPEDYPLLRAVLDFRAQLPELLRQEGMTVERLGQLMGVRHSQPAIEPDNEPNPQPSRKDGSPSDVEA